MIMKYQALFLILLLCACDGGSRKFYSFDFRYGDSFLHEVKESPELIESNGTYFLNDVKAENQLVLISQKIVTYQKRKIRVSKYSTNRFALDSNLLVYISETPQVLLIKSSVWDTGIALGIKKKDELIQILESFSSM